MNVYISSDPVNRPRVCVLGTGTMGTGLASNLAAAGLETRAWNRTSARAAPLADAGVRVCTDLADAVRDAHVVVTMLWDADAVEAVLREARGGWAPDAVLLQTTTVGVDGAGRLAAVAAELGLRYVDAPVQGTKQPAEQGTLVVLASGPEDARPLLTPVLEAIGSRTIWLGPAGAGTRLKLATNAFVLNLTAALAESLSLATALGVGPAAFLDAITGGPLESPYVAKKGGAMLTGDFTPAFAVDGGLKDARLIVSAAAEAGVEVPLIAATGALLDDLVTQGFGGEDLAALMRLAGGTASRGRP
jgi:3-hydroxyisobutyrate dehydrogenase